MKGRNRAVKGRTRAVKDSHVCPQTSCEGTDPSCEGVRSLTCALASQSLGPRLFPRQLIQHTRVCTSTVKVQTSGLALTRARAPHSWPGRGRAHTHSRTTSPSPSISLLSPPPFILQVFAGESVCRCTTANFLLSFVVGLYYASLWLCAARREKRERRHCTCHAPRERN